MNVALGGEFMEDEANNMWTYTEQVDFKSGMNVVSSTSLLDRKFINHDAILDCWIRSLQ